LGGPDRTDGLARPPLRPASPASLRMRPATPHTHTHSPYPLPTPTPPATRPPPHTIPPQAGSKVVCVEDGLPTWVCELMVVKPTVEEAIAFIKDIEAGMDIVIDPPPKAKA
jgi:hypothetical protein